MFSLDTVKELRKALIYRGKTQPGFSDLKKPKNKHMTEKYHNPNNIDESGSITEEDAEVLYDLVRTHNPKVIIEVGTWFGTSAMVMDKAGDAKIYTCDRHKLYAYDSDKVFYYNGWSTDFFDKLITDGVKADFVFLDGRLQGDEGKLLKCTADEFVVFIHDYEKPKKGWKNVRALQKLFPGAAFIQPSKKTALMSISKKG